MYVHIGNNNTTDNLVMLVRIWACRNFHCNHRQACDSGLEISALPHSLKLYLVCPWCMFTSSLLHKHIGTHIEWNQQNIRICCYHHHLTPMRLHASIDRFNEPATINKTAYGSVSTCCCTKECTRRIPRHSTRVRVRTSWSCSFSGWLAGSRCAGQESLRPSAPVPHRLLAAVVSGMLSLATDEFHSVYLHTGLILCTFLYISSVKIHNKYLYHFFSVYIFHCYTKIVDNIFWNKLVLKTCYIFK